MAFLKIPLEHHRLHIEDGDLLEKFSQFNRIGFVEGGFFDDEGLPEGEIGGAGMVLALEVHTAVEARYLEIFRHQIDLISLGESKLADQIILLPIAEIDIAMTIIGDREKRIRYREPGRDDGAEIISFIERHPDIKLLRKRQCVHPFIGSDEVLEAQFLLSPFEKLSQAFQTISLENVHMLGFGVAKAIDIDIGQKAGVAAEMAEEGHGVFVEASSVDDIYPAIFVHRD